MDVQSLFHFTKRVQSKRTLWNTPMLLFFFPTFVIQAIKVSTSQYSNDFIIFPTFVIQALQASSSEVLLQMFQLNCGKICHIFRQWHNVYLICPLQSYTPNWIFIILKQFYQDSSFELFFLLPRAFVLLIIRSSASKEINKSLFYIPVRFTL